MLIRGKFLVLVIDLLCLKGRYICKPCKETVHDDVIKRKYFLRYWPFVKGIHRSPVNSLEKASDTELWCFLWSAPEQAIEQTIEKPVIWNAIALITTSL